jgi:hypothetical protein
MIPEYDAPPLPAQTTRSNHSTRSGHLQVAQLILVGPAITRCVVWTPIGFTGRAALLLECGLT